MDEYNKPRADPDTDEDTPDDMLSDEDIKALETERNTMSESFEDMGRRHLKEALPSAIASIVRLAEKGGTDTIRFKAAQYIIDRNLGPVTSQTNDVSKSKHEELLDSITMTIPAGAEVVTRKEHAFVPDREHNPGQGPVRSDREVEG